MSFDDENAFGASPEASSDEEQNDQMVEGDDEENMEEDGDGEGEGEGDAEEDEEGEGESEDERTLNEGDDSPLIASRSANAAGQAAQGQDRPDNDKRAPSKSSSTANEQGPTEEGAKTSGPTVTLTSPSPQPGNSGVMGNLLHPTVRAEALTAAVYDIVPTIAAPQSTSINTITATPDLRWVFSGGTDGYIRKFNWIDTINGKLMLTVAQRHPFVDSVTKAGMLTSYWENEDPNAKSNEDGQALSPVYSLAVHSQALWLLSGTDSGAINLQAVRHDEGKRIHSLKKHTSAVSVLQLAQDERSVLSGSWDKTVIDWDLNTGQVIRTFDGSGGQISALEMRPLSSLPVPQTAADTQAGSNTFLSNNASGTQAGNDDIAELFPGEGMESSRALNGAPNSGASPSGSLFGDNDHDSLFGDDDNNPSAAAPSFGDDMDDEFSQAIANGMKQQEDGGAGGDVSMMDATQNEAPISSTEGVATAPDDTDLFGTAADNIPGQDASNGLSNGLPHSEETDPEAEKDQKTTENETTPAPVEDSVFLAASIDGSLRIWDKRKPTPIARIHSKNAPPWCMGACWSPDGNSIYAGRRNGTVEEFSLHKGLRAPERTFRFPNGSGPVSAVRAMPNGRHLICASYDILRLYDLQHQVSKQSSVPFLIVPGHRTGTISQLYLDATCRFMISTAGNRGWEGYSTQVLLGYEVNI